MFWGNPLNVAILYIFVDDNNGDWFAVDCQRHHLTSGPPKKRAFFNRKCAHGQKKNENNAG
jgi:hypothetical protein